MVTPLVSVWMGSVRSAHDERVLGIALGGS
jgi:hypothetical protein